MATEMSDTITRLQEKYNPLRSHGGTDQIATASQTATNREAALLAHPAWMASGPVILLIEYLRKYPGQRATLYESSGEVGLSFKPGINAAQLNDERGQLAKNMISLLQDAAKDLRAMIAQGIEIPLLIHIKPKEKKEKKVQ